MTSNSRRKLLLGTAFAAGLASLVPGNAQATDRSLDFNSLMMAKESAQWKGFTYIADDTVSSLNDALTYGGEQAHNLLGMDDRGMLERAIYTATVGQLIFRASWANSVMAHEYAHFSNAHRFGLKSHYFEDTSTGEHYDWQKAWKNIFLKMEVGGPATSTARPGDTFDNDLWDERGIEVALAGLNWQMRYSENKIRDWIGGDSKTFLDSPDIALNRLYTLSYALFSDDNDVVKDDIQRFKEHIRATQGEKNISQKIIISSLISNLLSPNLLTIGKSAPDYIYSGKVKADPLILDTVSGHRFTWDIPQYLNRESMTVAPIVYWLPNEEYKQMIGADNLVVGAGFETSVLGKSDNEARLTVDSTWGNITVGSGLSVGSDGQFLEVKASYQVAERVEVSIGTAQKFGDTLRGTRDLPDTKNVTWAGVSILF